MNNNPIVFKIKSTKWYGRFWPPERRKIQIMQILANHMTPEIEKQIHDKIRDNLLYGIHKEGTKE